MNAASLSQQWQQLSERVGRLSQRERWMMLVTGLVLLLLPLGEYWIGPALERQAQSRDRIESLMRDGEIARLGIEGRKARLGRDPNAEVSRDINQSRERLAALQKSLREQTVDLIAAEEMPAALQGLLAHGDRLRLISMTSRPPEPLLPPEQKANLYRHEIELVLEGGYFDVYRYLQALEGLPRHFYWRQFDYRVEAWPQARVSLAIYTLSASKEFIRG
ncbi:msha biogenesis protein mshj [Aeromonas diversa CDC 2478-85]|uniref:Msha biogenesis protein mshj n=1 Tax=Aeromonas diversa CDC 2478-85 TaxID=1268237 RepID=N9U0X3_9GAMM|nr:hypothetical protein [Aeromonas diversa]ENY72034.1 msha biogenesis protein mshj [Aeromonas diversa CDC 2478-85]